MNRRNIFKYGSEMSLLLFALTLPTPDLALATTPESGFYDSLQTFHGHTCAGSLMGARLGLAAKAVLKAAGGEGKLKAKYFDHSCPVDGVQFAAGTTYGNRAIEVHERNEQRLLLTSENDHLTVEARLTPQGLAKGKKYRELSAKLRDLPQGAPKRQQIQREINEVLNWFKTATEGDVVVTRILK